MTSGVSKAIRKSGGSGNAESSKQILTAKVHRNGKEEEYPLLLNLMTGIEAFGLLYLVQSSMTKQVQLQVESHYNL